MTKTKKRLITIGIIFTVIATGILVLIINMGKNVSAYNDFDYSNLDLSSTSDGTYTGSEDAGIVKASVEVTVKDYVITQVTILSHECGKGKPAEIIVNDIVEQNNLDVDAISGATFSSGVIKMAAYNALTK